MTTLRRSRRGRLPARGRLSALVVAASTALAPSARVQAQTPGPADETPPAAPGTRVVLLGTGTPNPDPARSGPAAAVVVNGESYVVDCGPGIVRRAAAAAAEHGIDALRAPGLRRVFITHLHSDHTVGCPDLMLSPWVLERDVPIEIYGPPGTRRMVENLVEAYRDDIDMRLNGLEPANAEGWKADAHDVEPGLVYEDANVRVLAFQVDHGSWEHAFGYRFETPDRTVVFSGDTAPSDAVVEACDRCDVLVHEVYSAVAFQRRAPVWQRYHSRFHTSTRELAAIAARARPGLLVLTHQLFWGVAEEALLAEIGEHYDGRVVSGDDLDVF